MIGERKQKVGQPLTESTVFASGIILTFQDCAQHVLGLICVLLKYSDISSGCGGYHFSFRKIHEEEESIL